MYFKREFPLIKKYFKFALYLNKSFTRNVKCYLTLKHIEIFQITSELLQIIIVNSFYWLFREYKYFQIRIIFLELFWYVMNLRRSIEPNCFERIFLKSNIHINIRCQIFCFASGVTS